MSETTEKIDEELAKKFAEYRKITSHFDEIKKTFLESQELSLETARQAVAASKVQKTEAEVIQAVRRKLIAAPEQIVQKVASVVVTFPNIATYSKASARGEGLPDELHEYLQTLGEDPLETSVFIEAARFMDHSTRESDISRSLNFILVQLCAQFEHSIADLIRWIGTYVPTKIDLKGVTTSALDVFGSIDITVARRKILDERVIKCFSDPVAKWIRGTTRFGFSFHSDDFAEMLDEAYARRNVVVHAGGVAGETYCRITEDYSLLDEQIPIDFAYLEKVSEMFCLLLVRAMNGAAGSSKAALETVTYEALKSIIGNFPYDALLAQRYELTVKLADSILGRKSTPIGDQNLAKANRWHALKMMSNDHSDILEEVKAWQLDPEAMSFRIAQAALIEDQELLEKLLKESLEDNPELILGYSLWPILEGRLSTVSIPVN